jgi:hypothetical protein
MAKGKNFSPESKIPQPKSRKELCVKEINAILQEHNCRMTVVPLGAFPENGQFEYRSAEIRVEENPPRPEPPKE